MSDESSPGFTGFKDFVHKIVSVPKAEIDAIKEDEARQKKSKPKKQATKVQESKLHP